MDTFWSAAWFESDIRSFDDEMAKGFLHCGHISHRGGHDHRQCGLLCGRVCVDKLHLADNYGRRGQDRLLGDMDCFVNIASLVRSWKCGAVLQNRKKRVSQEK